MPIHTGRSASLPLMFLLASCVASPSICEEKAHGFEVLLHYRLSDGTEQTGRLENFHFIYYDRRFVKKSTGFGKPGKVEIRDVPHDSTAIQNDEGKKLKFKQLQGVRLEYQGEPGKRRLVLIATFRNKKKSAAAWPGSDLRNIHVAKFPHFLGEADGKAVEVPLPPLMESDSSQEKSLVGIEFQFSGQKKHRDWF